MVEIVLTHSLDVFGERAGIKVLPLPTKMVTDIIVQEPVEPPWRITRAETLEQLPRADTVIPFERDGVDLVRPRWRLSSRHQERTQKEQGEDEPAGIQESTEYKKTQPPGWVSVVLVSQPRVTVIRLV